MPVLQRVPRSSAATGARVAVQVAPRAAAEAPDIASAAAPAPPVAPVAGSNGTPRAVVEAPPSPPRGGSSLRDSAVVAALPLPAEGGPFVARPAPTRTAVMAAYANAIQRVPEVAAPPALPVARAASLLMRSPLARVQTTDPPATTDEEAAANDPQPADEPRSQDVDGMRAPAREPAKDPELPRLEDIADYVLERLRHELRDGRERLGFLLDDMR